MANTQSSPFPSTEIKNETIFLKFGDIFRKGAQDIRAYIEYATKFAFWLKDRKAYYEKARPHIVKLLLLAQVSLRQVLGVDTQVGTPFHVLDYSNNANGAMVQAYINLVESIRPHEDLFVTDADLYGHVRSLLATTTPHMRMTLPPSPMLVDQHAVQEVLPNSPASRPELELKRPEMVSPKGDRRQVDPPTILGGSAPRATHITATNSSALSINKTPGFTPGIPVSINPPILPLTTAPKAVPLSVNPVKPDENASRSAPIKQKRKKRAVNFNLLVQQDIKNLLQKQGSPLNLRRSASQTATDGDEIQQQISATSNDVSMASQVILDDANDLPDLTKDVLIPAKMSTSPSSLPATQDKAEPILLEHRDTQISTECMDIMPDTASVTGPFNSLLKMEDAQLESLMEVETNPPSLASPSTAKPLASQRDAEPISTNSPKFEVQSISSNPIFVSERSLCVRVVAQVHGQKEGTRTSVRFHIPANQLQQIEIWNNRKSSWNGGPSLCLTLGCYLNSELTSDRVVEKDGLLGQLITSKSRWPTLGSLYMTVSFKNKKESIPLSPPFQVTPENLVDVSPFLALGENVIELDQQSDFSQFTFILHAHPATSAQLERFLEQRVREEAWSNWIHQISRPFTVKIRPQEQTS